MRSATLIRLGGLAALIAGALRTIASFVPVSDLTVTVELMYLVIDAFILFGLIGIYAYQHAESGACGFLSFLVAVLGTAVITGPDGRLGGVDMYMAGAAGISIGLVFLAIGSLKANKLPRYVPALWILSTTAGVVALFVSQRAIPFTLAGVAFGLGFAGAGIQIWSDPALRTT